MSPEDSLTWLPFSDFISDTGNGSLLTVTLSENSPWFSGHFPGQPIVPGLAMLSFAGYAVRLQADIDGRSIKISGYQLVRFKQIARPDTTLKVWIDRVPVDSSRFLKFEITANEDVVCLGRLLFSEVES